MGTDTNVSNPALPIGVHPMDPSEELVPGFGNNRPVPADTPGSRYSTGAPPWKTDNDEAVPVFQRSAHDASVQIIVPSSATGPAVAVGRQKGRQAVTLTVPTLLASGAAPLGVLYGFTEDAVQAGGNACGILNVGDSRTISTEAPIWVAVIPGNATGAVEVLVEYNPPGGSLGGQ